MPSMYHAGELRPGGSDSSGAAARVAAVFAYNTAMLDERLPRKPLPRRR